MKTPEEIAAEIVDRLSRSSNVVLLGQEPIVAAIADAIHAERRRVGIARSALMDAAIALAGVTTGYLKPKGKIAPRALAGAHVALRLIQ